MRNSEFVRRDNIGACTSMTDTPSPVPENEYARRLAERQEQLAAVRGLHQRLWTYLIVAAVASVVIAYATLSSHLISTLWILLPSVVILSIIHSLTKNARAHSRVQRILSFYEFGVARLHHQWQGRGVEGKEFLPNNHVYAADLDLFGTGSLFELLCTARTGVGRAMLAKWLLNPAEYGQAGERQVAISELRDRLDLREDWVSVEGSSLDQASSSVRDWTNVPPISFPCYARALAIALPICLIVVSLLAGLGVLGRYWLWTVAVPIGPEALLAAFLLNRRDRPGRNPVEDA
jgi:hypothetical protein